MAVADTATDIGIDEATRTRDVRAAEEPMGVWRIGDGLWGVGTGAADYSEYVVDLRDGRCSCDDWRFRGDSGSGEIARCKHSSRILQVLEVLDLPVEADVDESLLAQRERWSQ